jgi:hypothetical protein
MGLIVEKCENRQNRLTFVYKPIMNLTIGRWFGRHPRESQNGSTRYLQMAEQSSCGTYKWLHVSFDCMYLNKTKDVKP